MNLPGIGKKIMLDINFIKDNKELVKRLPKNIKKLVPSLKHILIVDSEEYKKQIKNSSKEFKSCINHNGK